MSPTLNVDIEHIEHFTSGFSDSPQDHPTWLRVVKGEILTSDGVEIKMADFRKSMPSHNVKIISDFDRRDIQRLHDEKHSWRRRM